MGAGALSFTSTLDFLHFSGGARRVKRTIRELKIGSLRTRLSYG
jgi:hypothetical protein